MTSTTDFTSCKASSPGCVSQRKRTCWQTDTDSQSDEESPPAKKQLTTDPQTSRTGGAHDGGQQFEIKMAAVIGLRGMHRNDNFELATNVKNAGNFDNLVYTTNGRRYCLQLQHTEHPDTTKFEPSELVKLLHQDFETYYNTENRDNSEFIIYTNKRLGWKLSGHIRKETKVDTVERLFKTSVNGEIFNFIRDKNTKIDVYSRVENLVKKSKGFGELSVSEQNCKVSMISKFLHKLVMVTGQKGQWKLDKVISKEVKKGDEIKVGLKVYKQVLGNFKILLESWWRNRNENMTPEILRNWLQKAKTACYSSLVSSLCDSCTKNLTETGVKFTDSEISRLQTEINNYRAVHLRSDALTLCSTLILDCLATSKCIFVTLESLQSNKNMLLHAWLGGHWECLIVSCDATVQQSDITDTCLKMSEVIKPDPSSKRVIILTEYSVQQVTGFVPIDHRFKFEQLSEESQAMVLDKKIDFQGCEVTMRSVLQRHGNVEHVLGPELVTDLITEETPINIGGKLQENKGYYAPRVLEREVWLKTKVLHNPNDIFAVSGAIKAEVLNIVPPAKTVEVDRLEDIYRIDFTQDMKSRIFLLPDKDVKDSFLAICKKLEGKPLHWLAFNTGGLLWKMSQGGTDSLLDYVDVDKTRADKQIIKEFMKNGSCEVNEESIWDLGERTVLVVAEPGMGKSSTTTNVAWHTKLADPTSWVVRINWNDHTRELDKINEATFNLDTLVEFLCSAAFPDSKYTDINSSLLKQALQSSGNVTVLMDAFDEISPTYGNKAAAILSELMRTKVERVWATSRPVQKERLEKELSVTAYGMKNLSLTSQEHMLIFLWKSKAGEEVLRNSKLLATVKDLLRNLKYLLLDDNFTGCPLYITMIATVYEMEVETWLNSCWIDPRIDIVNLCEKFVERKLHIYLTEKLKPDITNPSVLDDHEDSKQRLLMDFEKCALAAILPPPMLASLHNKEIEVEIKSFLERVDKGKDKTGIVMNVVEGKPQFLHRTIAEYFTARWFSKNFESNRSVLEHVYFDHKYSFVRDMFDRMLARDCPLQFAVLEDDEKLTKTLLDKECDINAVDKGGRSVMHVFAARGRRFTQYPRRFTDFTYLVPYYKVALDNTDCVLQWTPLQYAIKSEYWDCVEWLIESNVDRSGLDMIRQRAHDTDYIGPIIIEAARNGHFLLLEFIYSIGVNIHQASSMDFPSPLHAAIQGRQLQVVRWLIKHGSDCNTRYSDGQTALFYAVTEGSLDVVRALVEEGGASVDVCDGCGRTAIDWANDYTSNVKNPDSFVRRPKIEGPKEIVQYLQQRVCKESSRAIDWGIDGQTPLMKAVTRGPLDVVRELMLEGGASLDVNDKKDTYRPRDTDSQSDEGPHTAKKQRTTDPQTPRTGGAHDGGQQFEIKMAAVIGLRGMQRGDNFELATNVKDAGNFADIVYTTNGWRYCLQLKHAPNPGTNKLVHSELVPLLQECFEMYKNMADKDQSKLIIYTNKQLGSRLLNHETDKADIDTIFKTSDKGNIFKFIPDNNKEADIYTLLEKSLKTSKEYLYLKDLENESSKEFLNKLIIFAGQKDQWELDDLIAEEIRNNDAIKLQRKEYKTILQYFKRPLETWWRNKGRKNMTPEMLTHWLQRAKTKYCTPLVRRSFESCTKELVRTGVKFSDCEISRLEAKLSNKRAVHLRSDALTLCSILLLDCLPHSKCIFVNFECLQSHTDELLHAWVGGVWEWLIVSCDPTVGERHISDTYLKLSEIIKPDPSSKRVIIVTEYSVQHIKIFVPIEHEFMFEQLSEESQDMVLDKKIDFQGCEVTMRSVLQQHGNVEHVLGPELVTDLITEGTAVNIGGKLHVNTGYYAPRVLERNVWLMLDALRNPNDVFAVSGRIKEVELKIMPSCKTVEFHSLEEIDIADFTQDTNSWIFLLSGEDVENSFMAICRKLEGKSLHWVEFNYTGLLWKMSRGGTDSLLDYVDVDKTRAEKRIIAEGMKIGRCQANEESIWDLGERTVLVVAEPGMGKSSTTSHVARHTKERDPTSWVVRINWNDHTRELQEIDAATFNSDSLVEFLCSTSFPDSKYTDINRSLLKQALQSSGNVTVLMDGFDEISPTYADKAAAILSTLMKTKVERVWVTSRPVQKERLEKELSVTAYGMKNLSLTSQEHMLIVLWKSKTGEEVLANSKLLATVKNLLRNLKNLLYDDNFTGCPLYITMIATVYEVEVETWLNSDWIDPKIDIVNLYEKFVERKLHIYLTEKQKADITNSSVLDNLEFLKEIYLIHFENCALAVILPTPMLESLQNKTIEGIQKYLDMVQASKDKTGIVMDVVEGKAQFIHRTFAEYFTARWFGENFESNRSVLEHILFDPNYNFVRVMFDTMMTKDCPLHCAVLERDVQLFETVLKNGCDVNAVDKGGRTVAHIIAAGSELSYDTYLQNNKKLSLENTDCVLQWTPLQYAIKSEKWISVERLLERNVDRSGLDMIRQRAQDPVYIVPIIKIAAMRGYMLLLEFIRSIGVNIHQTSSMDFYSPLRAAIQGRQLQVVRWLIKHGVDCNAQYSDGQTLLFHAVIEGSLDVVRVLVEEGGASVDVRDNCGRTVIDWVNDYMSDPEIRYFNESYADVKGLNETLKYLQDKGCKQTSSVQQNNDA